MSLPPAAIVKPVHDLDAPVPVRAWIHRSRHGWKQLDGHVKAWTSSAVWVEYEDEHGRTGQAWLWAPSVERLR